MPDKTLDKMPYSFTINALCGQFKAIHNYHVNHRILLGFSKCNDPDYLREQLNKTEKFRLKITYKTQGVSALTGDQLIKLVKWRVIPFETYQAAMRSKGLNPHLKLSRNRNREVTPDSSEERERDY